MCVCVFCVASVFAYGQKGSGKTYTMTGITDFAITDIYDYINKVILIIIMNFKQIIHFLIL